MNKLIQRSLLNALGVSAYVAVIATIMRNAQKIFGNKPDTVFAPIFVLMLFVLSAAITGGLVLGKPLLMYLNNEKNEAIKLFGYTLSWLAFFTVIMLIANVLF